MVQLIAPKMEHCDPGAIWPEQEQPNAEQPAATMWVGTAIKDVFIGCQHS